MCDILRHEDDLVVQTKFGGSVQKGTYVTGLSDVDVLLIVNQSSLVNKPPSKVIAYVRDTIQLRLPKNTVRAGKLAMTISYADTKWSSVVHPERFAERLIKVNNARGGRVVPVIKLAKAMADCFIKDPNRKISGYHMESLAIDAFKGYEGELSSRSMLVHFLGYSVKAAMSPIADSTGQSRYVDQYLGPADSQLRRGASTQFGQMRGKVNSCRTKEEFNRLFCEGN